eukprot:m.21454 g.21454  ORF g.21454 m.21454 type:complete len:74 (-) comp3924_c0_seq2:527-748(-)
MGQCCGRLWERLRDRWSHQRTNKYMQFGTRRQHDDESFLRELESDSEDDGTTPERALEGRETTDDRRVAFGSG